MISRDIFLSFLCIVLVASLAALIFKFTNKEVVFAAILTTLTAISITLIQNKHKPKNKTDLVEEIQTVYRDFPS
ncbi:MAG: hypothetical protein IGR93_02795 [Hydrococcus sp. C42_A2020_068]|uniref:hypothetical protein n=1 Tax=Pleurocapsa sp. PCC 7327 TaxID=118163 RepID=UPI00029F95D6|nr:hypothetical protein [Pleurocapsa sp. PCC 7327]AFY76131.1 hypothetical protein Ple7327_0701 [Pleurocapsa sp. PCC 7327]MBF2019055.1 hypothetical protein [Hydrococcus sp. C42_A2020_068]